MDIGGGIPLNSGDDGMLKFGYSISLKRLASEKLGNMLGLRMGVNKDGGEVTPKLIGAGPGGLLIKCPGW